MSEPTDQELLAAPLCHARTCDEPHAHPWEELSRLRAENEALKEQGKEWWGLGEYDRTMLLDGLRRTAEAGHPYFRGVYRAAVKALGG